MDQINYGVNDRDQIRSLPFFILFILNIYIYKCFYIFWSVRLLSIFTKLHRQLNQLGRFSILPLAIVVDISDGNCRQLILS